MKNIFKEIYAVLELRDNEILFIVGMYYKSEIRVLYKKSLEVAIAKNGVIFEKNKTGKIIKGIVEEANKFLGIDIKRVILIPPDKVSKINIFKTTISVFGNHNISKKDIDNIISKAKAEASFEQTRYVYFIRPFKYYLDDGHEMFRPPIGMSSKKLKLKSIIYSMPIDVWNSHMLTLKYAKLERQSVVPRGHVLGTEIASFNKLKIGLNIVEWNKDQIVLNSFVSGVLAKQIEIPNHYNNWLVGPVSNYLDCKPNLAKHYINSFVKLRSKWNNNLVIYSKFSRYKNKYIKYTLKEFNDLVEGLISKKIEKINLTLDTLMKTKDLPIIYIGEMINIGGIRNLLLKPGSNISIHSEKNMVGNEIWLIPLIGAIHHQHIINKQLGYVVTAVDFDSRLMENNKMIPQQINQVHKNEQNVQSTP